MEAVRLKREWRVLEEIGGGGFGRVYRVECEGEVCALKLVPKDPGAERELLFVDLTGAENVVTILETGQTEDAWALRMPLAERSLREELDSRGPLPPDQAALVLRDVITALNSISGSVVHRDLKPENVLLLNGRWCLADFGIARYVDATTGAATRKFALTPAYAAPERWRMERATASTDVYAIGIMAYEILTGDLPFPGPGMEDFREQHLHSQAPVLSGVSPSFAAIVEECLYKSPGARPSPANLIARLAPVQTTPASTARSRLAAVNYAEVRRRAESELERSREMSESERRDALFEAAERGFQSLGHALLCAITDEAPSASVIKDPHSGWEVQLGSAQLVLSSIFRTQVAPWKSEAPAFQVISHASLTVSVRGRRNEWEGRSHSLWYCDATEYDQYAWYETAFMVSPFLPYSSRLSPYALDPGPDAAMALWPGMATVKVAWPFERLPRESWDAFFDRWIAWLAAAAVGQLTQPGTMPERNPNGSWRRE